ncbi:MAG: hypothetical protein A2182_00510 [Candidatus Pacebacteria bacterium RIFOXYA1_FULL_38_18]|nr:MAG: hypothetical protein A2182_00510 [Candidatus Pacebacteria bacterium RIFOXYA1_FULL_38_18]OGJ39677.1 MAG: hypothetical protein A2411_02765 [Candidatus Pacebacteria bacterium RIFOXYC1_FULL_39_21]
MKKIFFNTKLTLILKNEILYQVIKYQIKIGDFMNKNQKTKKAYKAPAEKVEKIEIDVFTLESYQ